MGWAYSWVGELVDGPTLDPVLNGVGLHLTRCYREWATHARLSRLTVEQAYTLPGVN